VGVHVGGTICKRSPTKAAWWSQWANAKR
jgi:hypothetical protein